MLLLVGLGNPGPEHVRNRHNVGFMAVDEIVRRHGFGPWRVRFQGLLAEGHLGGVKTLALKPTTFMNRSGISVGEAARFYKVAAGDVVVFHDELDLAAGKIKAKAGGGHAGHNGLRSLDAHFANDYRRVRIGIGHPGRDRVLSYVLEDFRKEEVEGWVTRLIEAMADAAPYLARKDDSGFMTRTALLLNPPKPKTPPVASNG